MYGDYRGVMSRVQVGEPAPMGMIAAAGADVGSTPVGRQVGSTSTTAAEQRRSSLRPFSRRSAGFAPKTAAKALVTRT